MKVAPVLKYPGAKWNIAEWIIGHIPPHVHYLEPYFGSGAVFFNKVPSQVETINDIDGQVVGFFRILRDNPDKLARAIKLTPYSRKEYEDAFYLCGDQLEDARRFCIRCWMAYGPKTVRKTGWRNDVEGRNGNSCPRVWDSVPGRLIAVAERLKDAQIESRPAVDMITRNNKPRVLIYADPPYVLNTRMGKQYAHEMTNEDHIQLIEALDQHTGPALLSGYACDLYDSRLKHWERETCKALAEGGRSREEVLWINPVAAKQLEGSLFR